MASRKAGSKRSATGPGDEDATMANGNGTRKDRDHDRRKDDVVSPRGYGGDSPPTSCVASIGYGTEGYGAPSDSRRGLASGRDTVGVGAPDTRVLDPIIPLALGGAPIPPVAATVPGKRLLVESAVSGAGRFSTSDEPPTKRYHAPAGNGENAMGQSMTTGGGWQGADGGDNNQGGGRGQPLTPYPASARLPPPSSLRPLPLSAGRGQGARLMIKGTHPAVPERRIHAVVSNYGVVGKIEVLEVSSFGFSFVAFLMFFRAHGWFAVF